MVLFPSNIFKKLKINIEIDTGLSFSQHVSSSRTLSSLSLDASLWTYCLYHEGLSFILNETRKTGKEKRRKNYLDLAGIMYLFGTLIGVLGTLQADLSLETWIGNLRARKSALCRIVASPARASQQNFPQTRKREPAPRLQQIQAIW